MSEAVTPKYILSIFSLNITFAIDTCYCYTITKFHRDIEGVHLEGTVSQFFSYRPKHWFRFYDYRNIISLKKYERFLSRLYVLSKGCDI